ncbi:helix-turn-helix domain-containing protein [Acidiphilium sp. AL]|uniref:MerR family transcriptional regulator n=1 Tax=Acidiphilium sp. AL TaxID=2871704 RepID=UPI0021CB8F50|nr:helix-turn-helix domain-containing protein [Acidiphilium sp. AL]MCU4159837.1 helix-turn-helix domain-containing protein [Acidiphilium sp. AL]
MSDQGITIGALARAAGTTPATIRWYEGIGMLPAPARSAGNYRLYSPEHVARLGLIRRCRDLGFSLDAVRTLLNRTENEEGDCADITAIARDRLAELDRKIADLTALRRELSRMIDSCAGGTIAACRIVEALSPGSRS